MVRRQLEAHIGISSSKQIRHRFQGRVTGTSLAPPNVALSFALAGYIPPEELAQLHRDPEDVDPNPLRARFKELRAVPPHGLSQTLPFIVAQYALHFLFMADAADPTRSPTFGNSENHQSLFEASSLQSAL